MEARVDMTDVDGEGSDLPADFVREAFRLLEDRDVAAVACVCRLWRSVSLDIYPSLVARRWHHSSSALWKEMQEDGRWLALYTARHQVDSAALSLVGRLQWPAQREACLRQLPGLDCLDALLEAMSTPGPLNLGHRYWVRTAVSHVQAEACAAEMSSLALAHDVVASCHPRHLERVANLLAQVMYPTDVELGTATSRHLDALGAELRRRMAASGAVGGRQALEVLRGLLFSNQVPEPGSRRGLAGNQLVAAIAAAARPRRAGSGTRSAACTVPADGEGLDLQGNHSDYYDPLNSVLRDVLSRRKGIPISLGLIACLVAHRAGLRVQPMNMPMEVICRLRCSKRQDGQGSTHGGHGVAGSACGAAPAADNEAEEAALVHEAVLEDDLFMRVFDGGQVLDVREFRAFAASRGLGQSLAQLQPLTAGTTAQRMCLNLVSALMRVVDMPCLKRVLGLALTASPDSMELLHLRARVSLVLCDFEDAGRYARRMRQALDRLADASSMVTPQLQVMGGQLHKLETDLPQLKAKHEAMWAVKKWPRPSGVEFWPGDVMLHKRFGYRGVIYDYDLQCMQDETWIRDNQVDENVEGGRNQPWYKVLVDGFDGGDRETYVAQSNVLRPQPQPVPSPLDQQQQQQQQDALLPAGNTVGGALGGTAGSAAGSHMVGHRDEAGSSSVTESSSNSGSSSAPVVQQPSRSGQQGVFESGGHQWDRRDAPAAGVSVPASEGGMRRERSEWMAVQNDELGAHFVGRVPGAPRFTLNAYLTERFGGG